MGQLTIFHFWIVTFRKFYRRKKLNFPSFIYLFFFSVVLDIFGTLLPGILLIEMAINSLIPTLRFTCVILKRYIKVREFVYLLPTDCYILFLFFCNTNASCCYCLLESYIVMLSENISWAIVIYIKETWCLDSSFR